MNIYPDLMCDVPVQIVTGYYSFENEPSKQRRITLINVNDKNDKTNIKIGEISCSA